MKKIFLSAITLIAVTLISSDLFASSILIEHNNSIQRKANDKGMKGTKNFVWPVANIGFTDACGNCWEYAISAPTWDGIWTIAERFKNMYEYGFCGYFIQSQ